MKQKHLYSLLDTSYTTIAVVFTHDVLAAPQAPQSARQREPQRPAPWASGEPSYQGRSYTYKVAKDVAIAVDDFVVVHGETRGLAIARVVRVDETPQIDVDASFDYKWIVQRVDRESYQRRVDAERCFADSMMEIERVRQRELMLKGFHETLPEGSEARKLFDRTVQALQAPIVDNRTAPASEPHVAPDNRTL